MQRGIPTILDDANNRVCDSQVRLNGPSDGILVRPKAPCHHFVDHCYRLRVFGVPLIDRTPAQHLDAHRLEVSCRDHVAFHEHVFIQSRLVPGHRDVVMCVRQPKRQERRERRGFDSRQRSDAFEYALPEFRSLGLVILGKAKVHRDDDAGSQIESGVYGEGVPQTADEQSSPGQ